MRYFVAVFVIFALMVVGTLAEAQAPPSDPRDPVIGWIEDLVAASVSGEQSEQKIRDYYRLFLSSKSRGQVTEDQFVGYWQHVRLGAQGGQPPELAYSIGDVAYNQAHDQAHVAYRYRLFAHESTRTASSDVALEAGVWKMALWPEIIAEMQKQPATQSRPPGTAPSSSTTVPSRKESSTTTSPSPGAGITLSRLGGIVEGTVAPISSNTTICVTGPGCSVSTPSITEFGAHLRVDPQSFPWGVDLRYLTGTSGGVTDTYWIGYITYRWDGPSATIRVAAGYENENGTTSSSSFTQKGPVVGIEGVFNTGKEWSGTSIEGGALYLPSLSSTSTVSGSSASFTGTGWWGYVGIRYTAPSGGFTLTGGYTFLIVNLTGPGGYQSENSSGPYISAGISF